MALTQTPILTPSQYHELPSASQSYYEHRLVVKQNNSDGLVHTYHVEKDTPFPTIMRDLTEKINNDFNIDVIGLIPNCSDNLEDKDIAAYLEDNHLLDMDLDTRPAWWVVCKTGGYYYIRTSQEADPAAAAPVRVTAPPPNTCSVCLVPSYVRISNYNCTHHLCCECFENWDNTDGQGDASSCPECRASCR